MPYADPRDAKARRVERYRADPDLFRQKSRDQYAADPEPARKRARLARERARRAERQAELEAGRDALEVDRQLRASVPAPVPYNPENVSWQERAGCVGLDPELFFARHVGVEARSACLACPVRAECLGMALSFPSIHLWGFWGGTTHQERVRLRAEARDSGVTERAREAVDPSPQVSEGETPANSPDC